MGGVQIDCAATVGLNLNGEPESWGLKKDARFRLWPANSPWIEPGTFSLPLPARWLARNSQMANEPVFVDGPENPLRRPVYYHNQLDMGGVEGWEDVLAATDGVVVSVRGAALPEHAARVRPRPDVVYLRDHRGWYYRYSHMCFVRPEVRLGAQVKMGQRIGVLGREGGAGWSHLHFGIYSQQPSGEWATLEAYAFLWEAYLRQFRPKVIAMARPHHLLNVGEEAELDGGKSWSAAGAIDRYEWTFTDGTTASGQRVRHRYTRPGQYTEVLKVTDRAGETAYDIATVQVLDKANPKQRPTVVHAAFTPTLEVTPGRPVIFKVMSFAPSGDDGETWDFGDGTPKVTVKSIGTGRAIDQRYAITEHRFARPGDYIVSVERGNARGERAIDRVWVRVERGP